METFQKIIDQLIREMDEMTFHHAIYEARERIGLRLYRAAELSGMPMGRLKRLETGMYRSLPHDEELEGLHKLYGLPLETMREKAAEHVKIMRNRTKMEKFCGIGQV